MRHPDFKQWSTNELEQSAIARSDMVLRSMEQDDTEGVVLAQAAYFTIKAELAERNYAKLCLSKKSAEVRDRAHRTLAFFQAQAGFWNSQAAALIDQSEGAVA